MSGRNTWDNSFINVLFPEERLFGTKKLSVDMGYQVRSESMIGKTKIINAWLRENNILFQYIIDITGNTYYFKSEKDALFFKLRWM